MKGNMINVTFSLGGGEGLFVQLGMELLHCETQTSIILDFRGKKKKKIKCVCARHNKYLKQNLP